MKEYTTKVIIEKIEKIVLPVVENMGFSLVDVEYMQEGGYWYVRIFVEDLNGDITLDDCAKISSTIEDDIDKLIDKRFFLEVSSPGIERPLKKIDDFNRFKDEKIKISLKHKIDDTKNFIGINRGIENEILSLEIGDKMMAIPFKEIRKANIVFEFDEF